MEFGSVGTQTGSVANVGVVRSGRWHPHKSRNKHHTLGRSVTPREFENRSVSLSWEYSYLEQINVGLVPIGCTGSLYD